MADPITHHWCIAHECRHGTLNGSLALGSLYLAEYQKGYEAGFSDASKGANPATYEQRVEQMAAALHRDCELEWQAFNAIHPGRLIAHHGTDTHYGSAHNLVRRIWPELDR